MSRRLIAVGLVLATVLTACNGNLSKEREKQLQDSFAAVMSNKDAGGSRAGGFPERGR